MCCQIGAREHYAVARALHLKGSLLGLFTDAWVRPGNPLGLFNRQLRERYHCDLADATVIDANVSLIIFEARSRAKGLTGWSHILERNTWFQRQALRHLSSPSHIPNPSEPPVLFAYSYAARDLFRWAKSHGWRTVLGQIDAGPEMGRVFESLQRRHPEYASRVDNPPKEYWEGWRDECSLADRIVVNSEWSLKALEAAGISAGKVRLVPVAYAPPDATAFQRHYPAAFCEKRPMRILFLCQITLAKGLIPLLEAAEKMAGEPVEFQMVGPVQVEVPEKWRRHRRIRWVGPLSRGQVAEWYRNADVFLFPTFSDGFGLTQLEAQAWRLPVISSRFCGDVVNHGENGLRLNEVNPTEIERALRTLLAAPSELSRMARASGVGAQFTPAGIAAALEGVLR